jgi:Mrp family chromosome partitioning ATPase/capsular polysaccharide biosynthesis protein
LAGRGVKPLASLLAHRQLAAGSFSLILLIGLVAAWFKGAPFYEAEASIQVAPRYMRNLREDQELDFQSNSQYRQFVEHQRQSVLREDVLTQAIDRLGDRQVLWIRPTESKRRAVARLRNQLQISAIPDTYLLRLSLSSPSPDGLAEMVNAVASAFIDQMKTEEIFGADERTKHLRQRESELLKSIQSKSTQRSEIARELRLTSFSEGASNPYDALVAGLRNRLSDAHQKRIDAEESLASFRTRGETTLAARSVQESILGDAGLNGLKASLSSRRAALLSQKSGLRPDHPGAIAANRELTEIDAELARQTGHLDGGLRTNILSRLQGTAEQARAVESALHAELKELEGEATRHARLFQDAMTLTADIAQARNELNQVRERINFIGLESTSFGFLRLVAPALDPDLPYGPGRKKLALLAILAAGCSAVVAPVLRDLLDPRVRTVNDAQRLMEIAPAGWQIECAPQSQQASASQIFADAQLRRMAAALLRSSQRQQKKTFGFTACKPGAGTSTLVLELASALRSLGYRTLAVEANGFARDPRYAGRTAGLAELLGGKVGMADVMVAATDSLPERVAVGGPDRAEVTLARLNQLAGLLQAWEEEFDFVLLDMPPLLVSADAELLLNEIGQVLLVLRADAVTKGEVIRCRRLLQTIDPAAVGMVVNRIAPFEGGGYLNDLMLEAITARNSQEFFTLPRWKLALAVLPIQFYKHRSKASTQGFQTLFAQFDRIFIINLPERKDRREAITRELRRQGLEVDGRRVCFFAANRPETPENFPSLGARGCYLSHLNVLRRARDEGVQRLLVLEDDVQFHRMPRDTSQLAQSLLETDWDIAYPGHTLKSQSGPQRWVRCHEPIVCAHCYAIQASALPTIIDHLETCLQRPSGHPLGGPMHYDGALSMLRMRRPDLITLVASQSMAGQRSSRSDIAGPSWLDRLPIWGGANLVRATRNQLRRLIRTA